MSGTADLKAWRDPNKTERQQIKALTASNRSSILRTPSTSDDSSDDESSRSNSDTQPPPKATSSARGRRPRGATTTARQQATTATTKRKGRGGKAGTRDGGSDSGSEHSDSNSSLSEGNKTVSSSDNSSSSDSDSGSKSESPPHRKRKKKGKKADSPVKSSEAASESKGSKKNAHVPRSKRRKGQSATVVPEKVNVEDTTKKRHGKNTTKNSARVKKSKPEKKQTVTKKGKKKKKATQKKTPLAEAPSSASTSAEKSTKPKADSTEPKTKAVSETKTKSNSSVADITVAKHKPPKKRIDVPVVPKENPSNGEEKKVPEQKSESTSCTQTLPDSKANVESKPSVVELNSRTYENPHNTGSEVLTSEGKQLHTSSTGTIQLEDSKSNVKHPHMAKIRLPGQTDSDKFPPHPSPSPTLTQPTQSPSQTPQQLSQSPLLQSPSQSGQALTKTQHTLIRTTDPSCTEERQNPTTLHNALSTFIFAKGVENCSEEELRVMFSRFDPVNTVIFQDRNGQQIGSIEFRSTDCALSALKTMDKIMLDNKVLSLEWCPRVCLACGEEGHYPHQCTHLQHTGTSTVSIPPSSTTNTSPTNPSDKTAGSFNTPAPSLTQPYGFQYPSSQPFFFSTSNEPLNSSTQSRFRNQPQSIADQFCGPVTQTNFLQSLPQMQAPQLQTMQTQQQASVRDQWLMSQSATPRSLDGLFFGELVQTGIPLCNVVGFWVSPYSSVALPTQINVTTQTPVMHLARIFQGMPCKVMALVPHMPCDCPAFDSFLYRLQEGDKAGIVEAQQPNAYSMQVFLLPPCTTTRKLVQQGLTDCLFAYVWSKH
ncbi:hypothetical protein Pelo_2403 [Pelomyxa schiedti]|nr:hypothetical protein Pelo_2403 [Pelomyxa schiedti]